jgi:outer membrane murein-binding lipoprotein Lpp
MMKRISMLAVAGLIALPGFALAGGGSQANLERKIKELERQLQELKAQVSKQNEEMKTQVTQQNQTIGKYGDKVDSIDTTLEEKSEKWDLASRFQFNGDYRGRFDYYKTSNVLHDQENDTLMTNRLRLNMRAQATENVEFKGRLTMYKVWGMESTTDSGFNGGFPVFDGSTTRTPSDSGLYVDRAFVNWNNIGGAPVWFSVGRRPTTDGPPAQLRMNNDERMATPVGFMDYPFDGLTIGYGYSWGSDALGDGRIRFCYGRGFENGLQSDNPLWTNDTDFAGFNWDIFQQGARFLNLQVFGAFNLFNYPNFNSDFVDLAAAPGMFGGPRTNLGNIFHTSAVYMDKIANLNYFIAGGWSRSDPNKNGMFNDPFSPNPINTSSENGYSVYLGLRYDIDDIGLKLGAEYNHGSQYWVSFSPGNDDIYMSKLATRGNVYELYLIYDLPTGKAVSQYAKTFIRLGWQHYDYDYTGYFDWNVKPYDVDSMQARMMAIGGRDAVKRADQIYMTFEVYF